MNIVLFILAILPAVFLMYKIYQMDTKEKEPTSLLAALFVCGALAIVISMVLELIGINIISMFSTGLFYDLLENFIVVACVEEGVKFLVLKKITWSHSSFDYRFDALVYAVFTGLGFAAAENILYVFQGGASVALIRALTSVPGHAAYAVCMGLYYGEAKQCESIGDTAGCRKSLLKAFFVPVLWHGIYDFAVAEGFLSVQFLYILYLQAYKKIKKASAEDSIFSVKKREQKREKLPAPKIEQNENNQAKTDGYNSVPARPMNKKGMSRICWNCGKPVVDGIRFCPDCGQKLNLNEENNINLHAENVVKPNKENAAAPGQPSGYVSVNMDSTENTNVQPETQENNQAEADRYDRVPAQPLQKKEVVNLSGNETLEENENDLSIIRILLIIIVVVVIILLAFLSFNREVQSKIDAAEASSRKTRFLELEREEASSDDYCNQGNSYLEGVNGYEQDYSKAAEWYQKGAEDSDACAMYRIGLCYCYGYGVEQDGRKAVEWFKKGAEAGNATAMYLYGDAYFYGAVVEQDYSEAVEWYEKGAEAGSAEAMYDLGNCYYNGYGVEQDYKKAVEWYKKGADAGSADAMCGLGWCYYNGYGVEQDYSKAVEWFEKGAKAGDEYSMCGLGYCYYNGYGVEQDYKKAVEWYKKGAKAGDEYSMRNLGYCYYNGYGVEQDYKKAVEWYEKGAEEGNADAMQGLAACYINGNGVQQNVIIGYAWFLEAQIHG